MGRLSAPFEARGLSPTPAATMTLLDFVGVLTLTRILTELRVKLKPLVLAIYRALLSQSRLIRANVQSLTASPLRDVPKAAGFPVLGILPQMCNQGLYTTTMSTLFGLAQDCGLSCSSVGSIPIVYLRDPAIIRQVFFKNTDSITRFGQDSKGPFGINHRLIGSTVATADGQDWHRWRNGFLRHYNSPTALKTSHLGILRIAQRHAQMMVDRKSGGDLRKAMEAYALDSVWFIALGIDNVPESSGRDLVSTLARYGDIVGSPSHLWRHVLRNLVAGRPFREPDHVEQAIRDDIDAVVETLLNKALRGVDSHHSRTGLLTRLSMESGDSRGPSISDEVLGQARQIFALGHDPSALALFWALFELSQHADVVRELRKELHEKGCNAGHVSFDHLRAMPYLDAVVAELFRLHPPVTTTARRVTRPIAVETRNHDTVVLPQGTQLFSSVLLHRDKQVWGESADDFRPARWLGVNINSVQNRCEYLPFLTGPRACPCSGFVLLQVKTMFAVLLSRADIEIPKSSEVETCIGGVLRPARPVAYEVREVSIPL